MRLMYIVVVIFAIQACNGPLTDVKKLNEDIQIKPDYTSLTIPPNIAPLNFYILEEGDEYHVEISSTKGKNIVIKSKEPGIQIPHVKWKKMLEANKGEDINITVSLRNLGQWFSYQPITNAVALESIHPYLAYRMIGAQYVYSAKMKFCQRDLESFDEDLIYENSPTKNGCFNCHSFSNYDPDKFSMHFRQSFSGTIIKDGDRTVKLNTKTPFTQSAFSYVSFHPNGELLAYSVNSFNEYFTNGTHNLNEVTDQTSDLVVYNIKTNVVTTSPKVSTANRENSPSWSPDGKFLYYLSADEAFEDFNSRFYSFYSLVRIEYDQKANSWGEPDTIFNARKEGKSLTLPRISPDGKKILFCLIDYGYFSIHHKESDMYLMDLETRDYKKLDINSEYNDSYHAWSQDGRWVVFSSKRYSQEYTAPHFVYFDKNGNFHKPFILPQKDPLFYESFLMNYNVPEFINGKVKLKPTQVRNILYKEGTDVIFDEKVDIDALVFTKSKKDTQETDKSSLHNE